jgi:hypothetical protein
MSTHELTRNAWHFVMEKCAWRVLGDWDLRVISEVWVDRWFRRLLNKAEFESH